jgi:hypothetical protein
MTHRGLAKTVYTKDPAEIVRTGEFSNADFPQRDGKDTGSGE